MSNIPDHVTERAAIRQFDAGYSREEAERLAGIHPAETILLSIEQIDESAVEYARAWVKSRGLTAEDVSLRRSETSVYIISKREVYIGDSGN